MTRNYKICMIATYIVTSIVIRIFRLIQNFDNTKLTQKIRLLHFIIKLTGGFRCVWRRWRGGEPLCGSRRHQVVRWRGVGRLDEPRRDELRVCAAARGSPPSRQRAWVPGVRVGSPRRRNDRAEGRQRERVWAAAWIGSAQAADRIPRLRT